MIWLLYSINLIINCSTYIQVLHNDILITLITLSVLDDNVNIQNISNGTTDSWLYLKLQRTKHNIPSFHAWIKVCLH